ncbi:ATP-binding protein [Nonomuraea sp. NPDC049309]|uniref:ATP-binding protein n=1 Tax=Nonomuraea sp. NPDC049309 TaxID=3364350 RepID=UPI003713C892
MAGKWQAGNLPPELTSLVGRRAELDEVRTAVRRSRLVTLTGVGGVGKSRVALRAAAELRPEFGGGAWLVDLSALNDGGLVPHAIAGAFRLADQTARPMTEVLAEHLSGRELLLVIDSCEHLTGPCGDVVAALLAAVPGLRVLATSRRPLEVAGETLVGIEPLPVPPAGTTALVGDAVTLLAERAAEVVPGFDLRRENPEAVVRLCRRLEGIPLAIELAAARLRDLPIGYLADRLDDRFAALGADPGGPHDPPWHRALRTAVGWSHELCDPAERLLWARLSVFAGDFDTEAARQVCADERLPESDIGLLLDALAEDSVLTWLPTGAGERYRMLDTLREYGAAWLRDLGEEERLKQRHREHYLSLAIKGAAGWLGPGQLSWYDRMVGEHDNLRAALEVAPAAGDATPALELSGVLAFFWYGCGHAKEGRHYLQQALALARRPEPALVQALWADGLLAASQGDAHGAETRADQIAAIARELRPPSGDPPAAPTDPSEGPAHPSTASGDPATTSGRLSATPGEWAATFGRPPAAHPVTGGDLAGIYGRAALVPGGFQVYAATCVRALRAAAGVIRGDLVRVLAESEPAYRDRWNDEPPTIAGLLALLCRAHALTVAGRLDEAIAVLEDLRTLCDGRGEQLMRSHGDFLRGQAELSGGRLAAAVRYAQAALRTKRRLHDSFGIGLTVDLLALAAGAAGQAERAARLLGLAQRVWSNHGLAQASVPEWVAARRACEAQVKAALGDDAYAAAYRTGYDSDVDAGIAYALEPEAEGLPNPGPHP